MKDSWKARALAHILKLEHMAHHMRLCLMRPTGEPRPDAPSIQKLLDLVKEQLT